MRYFEKFSPIPKNIKISGCEAENPLLNGIQQEQKQEQINLMIFIQNC